MTGGGSQEFAAQLADLLRKGEDRTAAAARYVAMLDRHGQAAKRADVTYRCARGCMLARAYVTPHGIVVHRARYKLSPAVNEASSSPSGRAKNTVDGDRRWRASTFFLDQAGDLGLSCNHARNLMVTPDQIESDARATRRDVRLTAGDVR